MRRSPPTHAPGAPACGPPSGWPPGRPATTTPTRRTPIDAPRTESEGGAPMSKRHQSSRRRPTAAASTSCTNGSTGSAPRRGSLRAGRVGCGRAVGPTHLPRSAGAAVPLHAGRLTGGLPGCAPARRQPAAVVRSPRVCRGSATTPAIPRRRARTAVRARRGPNRPAIALGGIVIAFMRPSSRSPERARLGDRTTPFGSIAQDRYEAQSRTCSPT